MSQTPKPINLSTVLQDPAFPNWGKRFVREVMEKDVVDVCNVLEFLTKIWTIKCQEAIGLPVEPDLDPAAYRECVEALKLAKPIAETLMGELSHRQAADWGLVNDGLIAIGKALAHAQEAP